MAEEKNYNQPFLHTMKLYCRHLKSSLVKPDKVNGFADIKESIPTCSINDCNKTETWLCLTCYKIFCGRFGNKHMINHYENDTNKKHCITMSLTDLSFWCYKCNDYLHYLAIPKIFEIYKMAHLKRFGTEIPKKLKRKTKENPYLIFGTDDYNFNEETVATWKYGEQMRYTLETEFGEHNRVRKFVDLVNEFKEEHIEQVQTNDINTILEIIVTFDRDDLLKLLINHAYLSQFLRAKPLQSCLKKAIRSGNLKIVRYLVTQNVINIELFNSENDLKSLLFTILRGIEIGSKKHKPNCFAVANLFWPYLCEKVCELKQDGGDNVTLPQLDEKEDDMDLSYQILKGMNDDELVMRYVSLFMLSMIKSKMKYDQCIAIFDVLKFLRERFITFNTRDNIKNGWLSIADELRMNYLDRVSGKNNDIDFENCLELEMIEYLISGGMDPYKNGNDNYLKETVERGINNWNMRSWKLGTIKGIMPNILPLEINRLIIHMLCL